MDLERATRSSTVPTNMTLAQFLTTYGAKRQAPKQQAKAQDPKVLTLAQLQKQSRQLYFPFPAPRTKR